MFQVLFVFGCVCWVGVAGHGRLVEPPGRSTMWRYGYDTPHNSDDHQLSCGGFGVQYYQNNGKCGICGDRYDGPRDNEAGGKYATGTIVREYTKGQVEVTVNHGGWFEFRLCPNNNVKKAATQECLDKNRLFLENGEEKYAVPEGLGVATVRLRLPEDLTCSQCVLQWKWNTASNVRCDGSKCCRGCGPQEQFYGCADVSVGTGIKPQAFTRPIYFGNELTTRRSNNVVNKAPDSFVPLPLVTEKTNQAPDVFGIGAPEPEVKCMATKEYNTPAWNDWCLNTCAKVGVCPKEICTDACRMTDCKAKAFFRELLSNPSMADNWCTEKCKSGLCPFEYCEKSCWSSTYKSHINKIDRVFSAIYSLEHFSVSGTQ